MSSQQFDVIILGAGPAGYVSAIRLSQLGKKVAIIEKRKTLGGTCLNVGCVPTKTLLASTELFSQAQKNFSLHGITFDNIKINIDKIRERKNQVVEEVTKGIEYLMKKNKITVIHGHGKILSSNEVEISYNNNMADLPLDSKNEKLPHRLESHSDKKESEVLQTENIIIATGSHSASFNLIDDKLKDEKSSQDFIWDSTQALELKEIPEHLIIIGAGVIGLEIGSIYHRLGSKVSIIEMLPHLFYNKDKQLGKLVQRYLEKEDFQFYFNHKITEIKKEDSSIQITATTEIKKQETKVSFKGSHLLVSIGRKANLENLGLENLSIEMTSNNKIKVNPLTFETSVSNIYAIGDVIEGAMLAHKASEEGIAVAEQIIEKSNIENVKEKIDTEKKLIQKKSSLLNYEAIPQIIYTHPEIAFIGKGENEIDKTKSVVAKVFFKANARAKAMNSTDGIVKLIMNKETRLLEGLWIICEHASEMIAIATAVLENNLSVEKLANQSFAHPTLSEAIKEVALLALKKPIHS